MPPNLPPRPHHQHHHHHRHKKFHVRPEAQGLHYWKFKGPGRSGQDDPPRPEPADVLEAGAKAEARAHQRLVRRALWLCAGTPIAVLILSQAGHWLPYVIWRLKRVLPPMINF